MLNPSSSHRTTAVSLAPPHQQGGAAPYWIHWFLEMVQISGTDAFVIWRF